MKTKELKSYQRSIRMTETTKKYLLEQEGNGLNEQFENLVYNAYIKQKELSDRNNYLEQENTELEKEIREKRILVQDKLADVERHLDKIIRI